MKSSLKKQAERFLREQKNYRRWLAVFLCLAVVVTIGTTAALKYKGIAVTGDAEVSEEMHMEQAEEIPEGMRRHVHTEACYEEQLVLVCEAAKAEAESADSTTVDATAQTGGAAEAAKPADTGTASEAPKPAETTDAASGHTHSDSCYQVTGGEETLTCTTEEHTHGDGCYETKMVTETVTKTVPETVTKEVTNEEGNVSTVTETVDKTVEETVEKEEKVLTCGKSEHSHGASCYTVEGGERTLVCELEEGAGAESEAAESAAPTAEVENTAAADSAVEVTVVENTAVEAPAAEAAAAENTGAEDAAAEESTEQVAADAAVENTGTEAAGEITSDHVHDESCYELQMVLICGKEEGELEPIEEEFAAGVQECVAGNVKVIAAYGPEAEIPVGAVLQARQITPEEDPERYAQREAEYLEQAGEGAVMEMLLDIGFYIDGMEIEPNPDASVSITIEMLDDVYEDGEELDVIHFGSEETKKLDASEVETNEEGNKTTSFETNSFSEFGVGTKKYCDVVKFYLNLSSTIAASDGSAINQGDNREEKFTGALYDSTVVIGNNASGQGNWAVEETAFNGQSVYGTYKAVPKVYIDGKKESFVLKDDENIQGTKRANYVRRVLVAKSNENAAMIDKVIRSLASAKGGVTVLKSGGVQITENGVSNRYYTDYQYLNMGNNSQVKYQIRSFPSDAEVFNNMTSDDISKITLGTDSNGNPIKVPATDLKNGKLDPAKFTIRWYTFHYNTSNAWHVDGVLVRKTAKLEVEKEFTGDADAIAEVKQNFSINVQSAGGMTYTLKLEPKTDKSANIVTNWGYDVESSDPTTNTYIWKMDVPTGSQCIITENGYNSLSANVDLHAEYKVEGSSASANNTTGYVQYSTGGIPATPNTIMEDEDAPEITKISLRNNYLYKDSITINKEDSYSGNKLSGVTFKLTRGGAAVNAWKENNTNNYYLYNPANYGIQATKVEPNTDGDTIVEVGDNGSLAIFYNKDNAGTYTLTEQEYLKYEPVTVTFTITANGDRVTSSIQNVKDKVTVADDGSNSAAVINKSTPINLTVKKEWVDGTYEADKVPVEIELYRKAADAAAEADGTRVYISSDGKAVNTSVEGSAGVIRLGEGENKIWEKTIEVPMYVDGELQVYSVKETKIGDTEYDAAKDEDGYRFYNVTISDPVTAAENGTLTVTNSLDGATLTFDKEDEDLQSALADATFNLYETYEEAVAGGVGIKTAISAAGSGSVTFKNLTKEEYFMKETAAPEGYEVPNQIYKVVIAPGEAKEAKIYKVTDASDAGTEVSNKIITNKKPRLAIVLQKQSGQSGNVLDGAKFVLRKVNGDTEQYVGTIHEATNVVTSWVDHEPENERKFTTENGGIADLPNLEKGTYHLIEVEAPNGYNLLEKPVVFEITESLELEVNTGLANNQGIAGKLENADKDTIVIKNSTGVILPETGGPGTVVYTFGGLAMIIAISLMYGLNMRRKREKGGLN